MKRVLWVVAGLAVLVGGVALIGALLPKEHVASSTARFQQPPETIWETITDYEAAPSWRSDLKSVKRLPDRGGHPTWVESSKFGDMPIEVVESVPPQRLVTRIADPNLPFGGTWTFEIAATNGGSTLTITERGKIYNPFFRFFSRFVFGYHATMEAYLKDLGRKFSEEVVPVRNSKGMLGGTPEQHEVIRRYATVFGSENGLYPAWLISLQLFAALDAWRRRWPCAIWSAVGSRSTVRLTHRTAQRCRRGRGRGQRGLGCRVGSLRSLLKCSSGSALSHSETSSKTL